MAVFHGRPQVFRIAHQAGTQLQSQQVLEHLAGGARGGAAPTHHLVELCGIGHPARGGAVRDVIHPALDQRQKYLEAAQDFQLQIGAGGFEERTAHLLPDGDDVLQRNLLAADVQLRGQRLEVDPDLAGVVGQERIQLRGQPPDPVEQSLPRGLAQQQVEHDVAIRQVEIAGELGDVRGQHRHRRTLGQGDPDLRAGERGAGDRGQHLAQPVAVDQRRRGPHHGGEHRGEVGELRILGGRGAALQRVGEPVDDRFDQAPPPRGGGFDPVLAAQRDRGRPGRCEPCHRVQPGLGQSFRIDDGEFLPGREGRVGAQFRGEMACRGDRGPPGGIRVLGGRGYAEPDPTGCLQPLHLFHQLVEIQVLGVEAELLHHASELFEIEPSGS